MPFTIKKTEFRPVGDKVAFIADLLENGKVVGEVRNNGTDIGTYCQIYDGLNSPVYLRLMSYVTREDIDRGTGLQTYLDRLMARPCGVV